MTDAAVKAKAAELKAKLQAESKAYKEKVRARYNERLAKAKADLSAHYQGRISDLIVHKNQRTAEQLADLRARNRQSVIERNNRRLASEERVKIKQNANELIQWLNKPTDEKHVPTSMLEPVTEFLSGIDFISSRAKADSQNTKNWQAKMQSLSKILSDIESGKGGDDTAGFAYTLDPELAATMRDWLARNQGTAKISDMGYEDLHELNQMLRCIKFAVSNANKMYRNSTYENVADTATKTMDFLRGLKEKPAQSRAVRMGDNLLNVEMKDPLTYFNEMGPAAASIFQELRDGFDRRVWHLQDVQKYMKDVMKDVNAKEWSSGKSQKEFKVAGGTIKLTTAQVMSLYELMKRPQAYNHIIRGGLKADAVKVKGKFVEQSRPVHVTDADLAKIVGSLTADQKRIADAMQKYMADECSKWGNAVTERMYGYSKFGEKTYFPIKTDANTNAVTDKNIQQSSLQAIRNFSATKALVENARNAIMVQDIFQVFTNHVADMATYEGFTEAIADSLRWFNFKQTVNLRDESGYTFNHASTVQEEIARTGGNAAKQYFTKLLLDINGMTTKDSSAAISDALLSNYKAAAVMANIRVAIQQPTAYARAAMEIDPKYLVQALPAVAKVNKYAEKAKNKSAIALWKSWGFYETSIGQSLQSIITGQQTMQDVINDKAGILAQKGDDYTWGVLYHAVELETKAKHKDLQEGTKAFDDEVTKRFNDIVDRTQVVDSVLHRSQFMRSQSTLVKFEAAFQAEPTKTYNMLHRAVTDAIRTKNPKQLVRAAAVFTITSMFTAAAAAAVDALRDDDDKTEYAERWLDNFMKNTADSLNIFSLIPYVKDVISMLQGFESERMDLTAINGLMTTAQQTSKYISNLKAGQKNSRTAYGLFRNFLKATSQVTGIPMYAALREGETIYNNAGNLFGWQNVQTRALSTKDERELQYKDLFKAIEKNGDVNAAIGKQMTAGTNLKDIKSALQAEYKQIYLQLLDDSPKDAAEMKEGLVRAYSALDESDPEGLIDGWSAEKDEGYKDLDAAVNAGEDPAESISALIESGRDVETIRRHLGTAFGPDLTYRALHYPDTLSEKQTAVYSALSELGIRDASTMVKAWSKGGYSYDLLDASMHGDLSASEVVKILHDGGYSDENIQKRLRDKYRDELIELSKTNIKAANALQEKLIQAYVAAGQKLNHEATARDAAYKRVHGWIEDAK